MLCLPVKLNANSASPASSFARPIMLYSRYGRWLLILLSAALSTVVLALHTAYADDPLFQNAIFFGDSELTNSVAVGDFNGDGFLDIVQGNEGQSYVYMNDGQGSLSKTLNLGSPMNTNSVAVGDFNGDGFLDIVQGNDFQSYVYLNDGQGGFNKSIKLGLPMNTESIAAGDVNGDGFLDIVQGVGLDLDNGNEGQSYVDLNDGNGGFSKVLNLGSPANTTSVAVGDVNGDGFLDIIQGIGMDNINNGQGYVYVNDGQGSFTRSPLGKGEGEFTQSIAVGDFNGDSLLDIFQGNEGQSYVYLNNGQDGFTSSLLGDYALNASMALGDLNGDGFLDFVQGNDIQSYVYLNDGQGGLTRILLSEYALNASVALGDLNGDGLLDIVHGNFGRESYVYLNDGQSGFARSRLDEYTFGASIAVGDLNGDGFLDIIQGNFERESYLYLNEGHGNFSKVINLGSPANTNGLAVGDFNGDSLLDIVQGNEGQSYVYVNGGQGVFTRSLLGDEEATKSVAVGDLNNDGLLDIVQGNQNREGGVGQSYVYLNDGHGGFARRQLGKDEYTNSVAVGDLDGDGLLDIVQGNQNSEGGVGQSYVYLNDGHGGFARRQFGKGEYTTCVAVGDFNADGFLDIVQGNFDDQSYVYLNDGQGGFTRSQLGTVQPIQNVAVGDLNGDGSLDIVLGKSEIPGPSPDNVRQNYVYLNDGQGHFTRGLLDSSAPNNGVALGDLNADGLLDIVQSNYNNGSYIYLNSLRMSKILPNNGYLFSVTRPGRTGNANFFSTPTVLSIPIIPITYTLFDQEGDRVGRVEASYSLDGGGKWLPAVATSGTVTQNLTTGGSLVRAYLSPTLSIPTVANSPLQVKIDITQPITVAEVEVWVSITGTQNNDLGIALRSPQGTQIPLVGAGQAQGQNFQATRFSTQVSTSILSGTAPYTGTYRPVGNLSAFTSATSSGDWTLVITNSGTITGELSAWGLRLSTPPARHIFYWDTFASGFFGQSDNVVVRLIAYSQPFSTTTPLAGTYRYTNTVPGPYQYPYVSATTFPFRVRGTQVRVVDGQNAPVTNALVYRLPKGSVSGAELMSNANQPLTTASNGYLGGRGALAFGDQLLALVPITHNLNYTLYATSGIPNENGLTMSTVSQAGVQTLQVSPTHPLLLFDLDVSLEWDASNDGLFYQQLTIAFERASSILYDVSDGQIALGEVRIHPNREAWLSADVVIYANNNLRPRATMGGLVENAQDETQGLRGVLPNAYTPGQVRMGPIWDPFGQNFAELTQDWQRALAHELAHYLLYLPDNYLGVEQGILRITNCQGSLMTDAYNPDYSEFLTPGEWMQPSGNPCLRTVAATLLTGRSDWATVTHFYPGLYIPQTKLKGPALLPLNVTKVRVIPSSTGQTQPVAARNYDLRNEEGNVTLLRQAQAYLLQSQGTGSTTDDSLLYLGSTGVGSDRILVRGAQVGDKVCVLDNISEPARAGCEPVTAQSTSIQIRSVLGWRPDIQISPVTSTTFQITVTQVGDVGQLSVQFLPAYAANTVAATIQSVTKRLTSIIGTPNYVARVTLAYPTFEGFVRVYSEQDPDHAQSVTQFFLSGDWGPPRGWNGTVNRAWGANSRSLEAPVASGDGKVTILNLSDLLADSGDTTLQAVNDLPYLPPWLTPVGAGYRIHSSRDLTRTLMFQYNQRDVPPGYEQSLTLYYLPAGANDWQRLPTGPLASGVDPDDNLATVIMPHANRGDGIYALMATVQLQPLFPGWNALTYPVGATQSVTNALASLDGAYTTVYAYQRGAPYPWPLFDRTVDPTLAPLVNTLQTLEFGHNYLLYATQVVTPYIGVVGDGQAASVMAASVPDELIEPPATFYGFVTGQNGNGLQVGMTMRARIGSVVCGESKLQSWQGQLAYVIQVKADSGDGCGQVGRTVSFEIDGQPSLFTVLWDNRQVTQPLSGGTLYLPIIAK